MHEWLIVGLGNPGREYERTPHNAGRIAVEALRTAHADTCSDWSKNGLANAFESRGQLGGVRVRLLLPETFMNESGRSLALFMKDGFDASRLIVVHDDIDIAFGEIKISFDAGAAGHHGVESIIAHARTQAFHRVRIGIAPTDEQGAATKPMESVADYVIRPFREYESLATEVASAAVAKIERIIADATR